MESAPAILNPVMRRIGVSDAAAAAAFYRDVLGFEVRTLLEGTEAVKGPARIAFAKDDYNPYNTAKRPQGSAILFFQTNDLAGMRAAIEARGGKPGETGEANWVKLRMFEIRDPDGHALWFAESYDQPDHRAPSPMMQKALPELPFTNVPAAVAYYRDVLGFRINYQQEDLGVMDRDEITVLLIPRTAEHAGIGSFEVYIEDADALYAELVASGAHVQGAPVSRQWGLRDFQVLDLEGNRITFAQPFE